MESSFNSKLTLLQAALSFREEMLPRKRQLHFEGLFWLIDVLEGEIRTHQIPDERYRLTHIHDLKEEVERCFKEAGAFVDSATAMSCCAKLTCSIPEK
jgi:hypothetical protein